MTFRIVTREEAGLPSKVTSSDGSPRPPLNNEPWMTAHYTGNNIDYTGKDAAQITKAIQTVFQKSKPFEYNYVIGQNEDDAIIEYAGKFQAAHSAGENADAFGVLFLLGVGEDPTPLMIQKWRWLRETLQFAGMLQIPVDQRMHFQMPGAATACPGNIKNYWAEFLKPFVPPVGPPTNPGVKMARFIATPPPEAGANPPWLFQLDGSTTYCSSETYNQEIAKGTPIVPHNLDQYSWLKKAAGLG